MGSRVRRSAVNGDQTGPEFNPTINACGRKPAPEHPHRNEHFDQGPAHGPRRRMTRLTEAAKSMTTATGKSHHQLYP